MPRRTITCSECGQEFTHDVVFGAGRVPHRCPDCKEKDPQGRSIRKQTSGVRVATVFNAEDMDQLDFVVSQTGAYSNADAIRRAIRVYAAILASMRDMSRG